MNHSGDGRENLLDFYLSEMAVSDRHGGGITLQRILGDDLDRIGLFVHPNKLGDEMPPIPSVRARCTRVTSLSTLLQDYVSLYIGCRPSHWLATRQVARTHHERRVARAVHKQFLGRKVLHGLICPQGQYAIRALERLKSIRQVKYVSWIMDDHIVRYVEGRWAYPANFRGLFAKHLREADSVFVISPDMAKLYEQEFGVKSTVLFGPSDELPGESYEAPSTDGVLRIGYFGRLWDWQLEGLVRLATALNPSWQKLDIYTPDNYVSPKLLLPSVTVKGYLPKEAVRQTMLSYDAVLLPISFDASHRNLVELNISTKMSECLASGAVTIVFGPHYAAMVRFLQGTGAACLVTDESLDNWQSAASRLLDITHRRKLLAAARSLVRSEISTEVMRRRWRDALAKLSGEEALAAERSG